MSIPTPSFWKIRKYLLIVILIIYCFVIGSLKQAFGAYDPEKSKVICTNAVSKPLTFVTLNSDPGYVFNQEEGTLSAASVLPASMQTYFSNTYRVVSCDTSLKTWQIHSSLIAYQSNSCSVDNSTVGSSCNCPAGEEETVCGCKPICPSGNRTVPGCECINYCPYSNGRTPGLISSPYGGLCVEPPCSNYEITNPDGTCTHNCTVAGQQMDVTTGECFTPEVKCGPCETKVGNDCLAPEVCPQGQHRNYETCQCVETPEDTPECPKGQHYHWGFLKCVPDVVCPGGQYHNGEKCVDKVQPPETPPSPIDPKNTPTPTPERPADPPAPSPEQPTPEPVTPRSEDPWTAAVKDAVDRTNQILRNTQADLEKHKTDLTWIQSTMAAVNENLGKAIIAIQRNGAEIAGRVETSISNGIGQVVNTVRATGESIKGAVSGLGTSITNLGTNITNKLTEVKNGITAKLTDLGTQMTNLGTQVTGAVNGVKDGIIDAIGNLRGQLTGIDAGIGNVTEELRKINNGAYVTPADKEPYVAPEHDFNVRTTQFLDSVKSSPIFALPNQLSSSIPGGGSPILSINTGSTYGGEIQIDFSELSDGLLVLRALFQIMGITLAIRIITLKR